MNRSKQTPKPSRALIAAVQRIERPMMRRVVSPDAATVALVRSAALEVRALCEMWPGGERQCGLPANKSTGQGVAVCDRCLPRSLGEAEDMGGIFDLKTSERVAAPPPAPVAGEARAFAVGDRVRCVTEGVGLTIGNVYKISVIGGARQESQRNVGVEGVYGWFLPSRFVFEPAPSPAVELESDEALLRRTGWTGRVGSSFLDYALPDDRVAWVSPLGATPSYFRSGADFGTVSRNAPTLLQAACAALGIRIEPSEGAPSLFDAHGPSGALLVHSADAAESCARAALAAHHSRGAR